MAIPFGAAASFIGGLTKLFGGNSQKNKGQRLINEIGESPTEAIPEEVLRNQKMAEMRANTGLPSQQYYQAMRNLQRQQLNRLKQASGRGGALGILAGSEQGLNDAQLKLDVENANARMKNEQRLSEVNNNVARWKDKVWGNNVRDVWNRKYQYGMSLFGMGNQNKANGIDQTIAGGIQALSGLNFGGGSKYTGSGKDVIYSGI